MSDEKIDYLICHCCGAHFYEGVYSNLQASGCACSIIRDKNNNYIIDCGYGSSFDTQRYSVEDKELYASFKPDDLVCDNCIQKLSMLGNIQQDKEFDYWDEMNSNLDIYYQEQYGENYKDILDKFTEIDSF